MVHKYFYQVLAFALAVALAFMGAPAFGLTAVAETGAGLELNTASAGVTTFSAGDDITFVDANFKAALIEAGIDTNSDGEISEAEAAVVTYLNVSDKNISNMPELVYFTALTELMCLNNQLTELDVSNNTLLEQLWCENNQLTEINVLNNTSLRYLNCTFNQLAELDVSQNIALQDIILYNNQLTDLDVSNNTELVSLNCVANQLTKLDVSNNTLLSGLECTNNRLTELDVSNNIALSRLDCDGNQLAELDVSNNTALQQLFCRQNQLTELDVSNNTLLDRIWCSENILTELDVSNNTALTWIMCDSNQLTELDVSHNTALKELYCGGNQLTELKVSNNTALTELYCGANQLAELEFSNNPTLNSLDCAQNQLTLLDVSNNTALESLSCLNNQLTSLDVSNNTALWYLDCTYNYLQSEADVIGLNKSITTEFYFDPQRTNSGIITSVNITGIDLPAVGAAPDRTADDGENYTTKEACWQFSGQIASSHNSSIVNFESGKAYAVAVEIVANAGYEIASDFTAAINGYSAGKVNLSVNPNGSYSKATLFVYTYGGTLPSIYTVTFKDWDGATLKTETVASGQAATAPASPTRAGYTFTGWDVAFNNITSNLNVTAQYSINTYTVTFKDWNDTTLKTETLNYGQAATAPSNPTRTGYTFTGWDTAFDNVTSNLTVTAQYSINTFTVTFKDYDGTTLKSQTVNYGQVATAPSNPTRAGYTFTGWDTVYSNVTSNLTVTAQYSANSYTVTFEDWDGTTLKTETLNYGQAATAPTAPTRAGYIFTGWDNSFSNVTSNLTVTAQYSINTFTVTFKDHDDTILKTQTVNYGQAATAPSNPTRTGYTFDGWNPSSFTNITGNLTITAQYTIKPPAEIVDDAKNEDLTKEDLEELEDLYKQEANVTVNVTVDNNTHGDFKNNVSVIGAAFNADPGETVTLSFTKPDTWVTIDGNRFKTDGMVQVEIKLEGKGVNSTNLDVPVTITVPIPTGLGNTSFRILHYHNDGTYEVITPTLNGDGTCTFTVTNFSVFVFINEIPSSPDVNNSNSSRSSSSKSKSDNYTPVSPANRTSSNVNTDGSVNSDKISGEFNQATKGSNDPVITLKTRNAKTISASTIKKLAVLAAKSGKTAIIHADTINESGNIQGRLYIEPAKLTGSNKEIKLGIFTEGTAVSAREKFMEKWYGNKVAIISCTQQGDFGAELEIAAKIDLTKMDAKNLVFYSYDAVTNKFTKFTPQYRIDSKGYIHFKTNLAGDIIISDGVLVKK